MECGAGTATGSGSCEHGAARTLSLELLQLRSKTPLLALGELLQVILRLDFLDLCVDEPLGVLLLGHNGGQMALHDGDALARLIELSHRNGEVLQWSRAAACECCAPAAHGVWSARKRKRESGRVGRGEARGQGRQNGAGKQAWRGRGKEG
eukprot:scaffold33699_cov24-Tisochrysis_lutea.AAC.2